MLVPGYTVLEELLSVLKGGQDQQKFTLEVISFDDHVSPSPGIQTAHFTFPHHPHPQSEQFILYLLPEQACARGNMKQGRNIHIVL